MKKNTKRSILKSSIATTLALASISPIAIALGKQIVDNYQNQLFINSSRAAQDWTSFPNINKPTKEMFHNIENLVPLSSVGRGQMVTPYGWLGTYNGQVAKNPGGNFDQGDYWNNTLALVGWDGSIIWTNDESDVAIYSAKYNFATNTIFVVRTQDPTGAGGLDPNFQTGHDISHNITFTIHDAATGKMLYNSFILGNNNNNSWAFKNIFDVQDLRWKSNEFKKDLYYQDMITLKDYVLWYYMPNTLKMNNGSTYPSFDQFKNTVISNSYFKAFLIKKSDITNAISSQSSNNITPIDVTNNLKIAISNVATNSNTQLFINPLFAPAKDNTNVFEIYFAQDNSTSPMQCSILHCTITEFGSAININHSTKTTAYNGLITTSNFDINHWSNEYNNASLLHTRNMFDENLITVPYVYTSKNQSTSNNEINLPIFNVSQLYFHSPETTTSANPTQHPNTKQFDFGAKIYSYFETNSLKTKDPYTDTNNLKWYPWPNAIDSTTSNANYYAKYTEQLYSRLISVSPFDNTIIYASRPNYISNAGVGNNKDVFSGYSDVEAYYASFWIGDSSTGKVSNFVIPNYSNETISTNLIEQSLTGGIHHLYKNGFWFDVNSLSGQSGKLNLYFPTTGSKKNTVPSGADNTVKSTPIAFINPTLTYVDMNNLTSSSNSFIKTIISDNSFTNYITSRADLSLWFNRTYQNLTKGSNYYKDNEVLNDYDVNKTNRAVAASFNTTLSNSGFFGSDKQSVELFSNWQVGQYDNLAVKRAKIVTKIDKNKPASITLDVELQFILENNWNNHFIKDADKNKVTTFSYPVTISNASWQLLDSWSTNVKLSTFSQTSGQNKFNVRLPIINYQQLTQGNYGGDFGTHNLGSWTRSVSNGNYSYTWTGITGNTLYNNTDTPLWVEFGIDYDPENKADSTWKTNLENFESGLFKKTYPVEAPNNEYTLPTGATSFNEVLNKFIKWKAENLMYGDVANPTNNIYSPGQICIKAYLKLNPYFKNNSNNTIYTMPLDNGVEVQVMYDSTNDIRYVYRDEYTGSRVVYKQISSNWDNNSEYGFGSSVNSEINESWERIPTSSNNSTTNFVANLLQGMTIKNTLVREGTTKTDQIFSAKYSADMSSIILTPKNSNYLEWAKQRFSSFNQMVGRNVKFQYLLVGEEDKSQNWKDFNANKIKDSDGKNMFTTDGSYIIPFAQNSQNNNPSTLPNNIQKVRFVLYSLPTDDPNYNADRIVSSANLSSYSQFTSDAIALDSIPIHVDYNWLKDVSLNITNTNSYLNGPANSNIDASSFKSALDTYQATVLSKANNLGNLKDKLKLTYSLDQSTYADADALYNSLERKWQNYNDSNLGIISLYNNGNKYQNNVATKIYVKFAVKEQSDQDKKYEISASNFTEGSNVIEKTNIKYFINLQPYVNVLQTEKTSVIQGSTPNSITSFTPPAMTGNKGGAFLAGYSFDEITTVLAKFGITVEYQKNDNNWTSNKDDITSYNPNVREIKIRFKVDNVKLYNIVFSTDGTNTVTGTSSEFSLKLNLPILVTLDENVKNNFIRKGHISGNTWKINIDANKETIIYDIKTDGKNHAAPADIPTWDKLDQYLEVQYALSNDNPTDTTTFYNRQGLINHLQAQTETNYNNTIWARLHLITKQNEDPKFILTNNAAQPFKMNNNDVAPGNNKIQIYVQAAKYEQELDNIEVSGSTGNLLYSYPEVIQKVVDASSNSSNNLGIKIQYSLKQDITYGDTSGWLDQAPTSVPAGTSSIKVRIVVTDSNKYIYGMGSSSGNPDVHSIDLNNISSLIDVDSNWFGQVPLTIANNGYLKDIQESDINTWKNSILDKSTALQTNSSLKDKVEIKFQIEGNNNWYTAAGLVNTLKSMINDYSGVNLGIIYLWDGTRGLKINAKFEKKNESDKIIFVSSPNSTNPNTNLEGQVQTNQVKTYIDLSSYINVLKSNKTSVVLQNGQAGTIQSFTPPAMSGSVGGGFLYGKTYDEIANHLQTLGITFKFNNNMDNNWNTKENVNTYNQNNPTLHLGFEYASNTNPNITIKINNNKEITSTTQEQNLVLYNY